MTVFDDAQLFEIETPPPVSLADRFVVPPFSILDRRSGLWQDRKRKWLSLGIESELGRDEESGFLEAAKPGRGGAMEARIRACGGAVSVFDPVLCELAYRWFSPVGGRVLDPFAGGSVRGVVASTLLRDYTGIDLRREQVEANRAQAHLGSSVTPHWVTGDSADVLDSWTWDDFECDFIFSCPPYADLEVYSDDPADLSNMSADDFDKTYLRIIDLSVKHLRNNRFAAWVISDVRDKKGMYRGLVMDTISAFEAAGCRFYNDLVTIDPVGSGSLLAAKQFEASRKVRRMHQHMLVFVKGDPKVATAACAAEGETRDTPPSLDDADKQALKEYLEEGIDW